MHVIISEFKSANTIVSRNLLNDKGITYSDVGVEHVEIVPLTAQDDFVDLWTKEQKLVGLRNTKEQRNINKTDIVSVDKFAELVSISQRRARQICKQILEDTSYRWKWQGRECCIKVRKVSISTKLIRLIR